MIDVAKYKAEQVAKAKAEKALMSRMRKCQGDCKVVPDTVLQAVWSAFLDDKEDEQPNRTARTAAIAQTMARDKWRFCACFRHGNTASHDLVYQCVGTVEANYLAGDLAKKQA